MPAQFSRGELIYSIGRIAIASTLAASLGLVACSGSPNAAEAQPVSGADALQFTMISASAETMERLGVSSWMTQSISAYDLVVTGLDPAGQTKARAQFTADEQGGRAVAVVGTGLFAGDLQTDSQGNVVRNTLGAGPISALRLFGADAKRNADSLTAYDACSDAKAYVLVCAAGVAIACASVETGVGIAACGLAVAALTQANQAQKTACAPQNCFADWQCTDQFGPGWSCNQGACVQSTGMSGGCTSNADCSPGFTCDPTSGLCYKESTDGGSGDDGGSSSDPPPSGGGGGGVGDGDDAGRSSF
jgi:hypothetical protein